MVTSIYGRDIVDFTDLFHGTYLYVDEHSSPGRQARRNSRKTIRHKETMV